MTTLGPFAVVAERTEVDTFRDATGLPRGDLVPATFPMRWLATPEVRGALLAMAVGADLVPVHESQMFDYLSPLIVGQSYQLRLEARRETGPDRLVLAGTFAADDGTIHLRVETILRLFSTATVAA